MIIIVFQEEEKCFPISFGIFLMFTYTKIIHISFQEVAMLDPKINDTYNMKPKNSIVNLAINNSHADSLDGSVNITEEISKTANWRNLQSNDTHAFDNERPSSGKRWDFCFCS